jgi:hypothetical protein
MQTSRISLVFTSWKRYFEILPSGSCSSRLTVVLYSFHSCVDPDDRVYPRASSRVGARYQAVVVKWDGPGQILVTSTIFDDPQNNPLLKGRTKKGGRGGRPPSNKLKVPEGKKRQRLPENNMAHV